MSEREIRRRGWREECQRPSVNIPAGVFVARVFDGLDTDSRQIGLGTSVRSIDGAVSDAYRSAMETVAARPGALGVR